MNVILIYGGRSGEHEVSIVSCAAVLRNLNAQHNVKLIAVTKDGRWYKQADNLIAKIREDENAVLPVDEDESNRVSVIPGGGKEKAFFAAGEYLCADIVFPVMHGTYGEDGTIQGVLEMAGVPYVGCGVLSSAITMDKEVTKNLWIQAGLPVVPYFCLSRSIVNDSEKYDEALSYIIDSLGFPLFVKPCCAGSSDGASGAKNEKELSVALSEAFMWDNKVLIEKSIDAREIECSVTGNSITSDPDNECTRLRCFGPGEIIPTHEFYDYDAKYNDPDGAELKIPAELDEDTLEYIRETAIRAYQVADASGLSRVDFFIDRKTGDIYLNEINTIPGFTAISMFPKLCASEGLNLTDLIEYLFDEAKANFKAKNSLVTSR